jgi:hypothetical protein
VRFIAWRAVPGAKAAIAGAIVRVSEAGTIFQKAEVALARAEILHFAGELFDATQNLGADLRNTWEVPWKVLTQINIFLASLAGGEWSASRPCRFTAGEGAPSTHWIGWMGRIVDLNDNK